MGEAKVCDDSEAFEYHRGRVVHGEGGVAQRASHLFAVPVLFVARSPLGDGSELLAFVDRVGEVDLRKWCDADIGHLDNGDGTVIGVDHHRADAGLWQRLPVMLVLGDQPGGRGLRSIEDRGDQLVAQRAGNANSALGSDVGSMGAAGSIVMP